jgi:hypothetical protein
MAAALLAALLSPAPAGAQAGAARVVFDRAGSAPSERLGQSLTAAGDLNGDGRPDFCAGAPGWGPSRSDSTGRVLVFLGGRRATWEPDLVLTGPQPRALFGFAVAGVGDANGDGFGDLIVTAPAFSHPDPSRQGTGRFYLYFGGPLLDAEPDAVFDPPVVVAGTPGASFVGGNVAALGDANGDGFADWSVSVDRFPLYPYGGAVTYLGGTRISTVFANYSLSIGSGRPVLCGPGDMNGDGLADLALGAPGLQRGTQCYVTVYLGVGGPGGVNPNWISSSRIEGYGASLAPAGDLNRDGKADLLIGHPQINGGEISVWWGGSTSPNVSQVSIAGTRPDSFGTAVSLGRADGTAAFHLLVGACGDDAGGPGAGAVHVYSLGSNLQTTLLRSVTGSPGSYFGARAAFVGDADGNGEDDILAGSPLAPGAGPAAGTLKLITLSPHTLIDPHGPREWPAGGTAGVHWLGSAPARLSLSLDGGAAWRILAEPVGGAGENWSQVAVPDSVSGAVLVRVSPAGSHGSALTSDVSDYSISIVRSVEVLPSAVREHAPLLAGAETGRLGAALDGGRDADGDGRPDALLCAPFSDSPSGNAGTVWVLPGGGRGLMREGMSGEAGGDRLGTAASLGGDANGDGLADLLLGAPGGTVAGVRSGKAHLILGGDPYGAPLRLAGSTTGEDFGASVRWIGDFNRDGFDDFAVGAPFFDAAAQGGGHGRVLVYFGAPVPDLEPDLELRAPPGVEEFGQALAGLDLNGDGAGDLVVSGVLSEGTFGTVRVYFGGSVPDTLADLKLTGRARRDRFGEALARGGDLNGDGIDELLVGVPAATGLHGEAGRVDVFLGGFRPAPTPWRSYEGLAHGEEFGAAMAGAGDLNGDGRDDFIACAPAANSGTGVVRLYFGGSGASDPDGAWAGGQIGERFGAAVTGAGDMDGDGVREFLVGAPLHTYPGRGSTGRVTRLDAPRYAVDAPAERALWFAGGRYTLRWRGSEPADIALSVDAGRTWETLAVSAGGAAANAFELSAPTVQTDSAYVRLRASRPGLPASEVLRGPIAIGRSVQVLRFDYALTDAGIRLAWETAPALGAQGLSAYRLYREMEGQRERVGPERIEASEYLVAEFERGVTYVLAGLDGNGAEADLARLTVAGPGARLRAWPVPSVESGNIELAVYPPVDPGGRTAADFAVTVYDVNGREVRRVAGGVMPTRVGEVRVAWDGRSSYGLPARAGVYFVRAESPSRGFRIERRIVVLR